MFGDRNISTYFNLISTDSKGNILGLGAPVPRKIMPGVTLGMTAAEKLYMGHDKNVMVTVKFQCIMVVLDGAEMKVKLKHSHSLNAEGFLARLTVFRKRR